MSWMLSFGILLPTVFVTSFLSGIFGMAGGLILMGVLTLTLPIGQAMIVHGVTQMAANGWRCILWRRHILWPLVAGFGVGAVVCLAVFAFLAFVPNKAVVLIVMGLLPFVNLALPAWLAPSIQRPGNRLWCGVIVTALNLTSGVSGLVLDLFFVNAVLDRRQVVATKAVIQTLGHVMKLIYFGGLLAIPAFSDDVPAWIYGLSVIVSIAGTTSASGILDRLTDRDFRRWSLRIVTAIGAVYLVLGAAELIR